MKVTLLSITPDSEFLIEKAGRICYNSSMSSDLAASTAFIRKLIRSGHFSVLEHASATFHIAAVSRALTHQLVRHRLASYSQQSQRYVKVSCLSSKDEALSVGGSFAEDCCVHPVSIYKAGLGPEYHQTLNHLYSQYRRLLDAGVPAEDARMLLPNAVHTELVMTANFREWRHFLDLRCDAHAQWEIRELAWEIAGVLKAFAPSCFDDYKPAYHPTTGQKYLIKEKTDVKETTKSD